MMSDDFDVEAMLEAPYIYKKEDAVAENGGGAKEVHETTVPSASKREEKRKSRSKSKERSKDRHKDRKDRDKDRDRDRDRHRDRDSERTRDRDRDHGDRNRERERGDRDRHRDSKGDRGDRGDRGERADRGDRGDRGERDVRDRGDRHTERERRERRSRSRERERYGGYRGGADRWGGGGGSYRGRGGGGGHRDDDGGYRSRRSRSRERKKDVSPVRDDPDADTRDARTVFVMQLSQRAKERELKEFFSSVGKVRSVKIITDRNSRRSKGVGYVEFDTTESVPLAMGLNNQKLLGIPIIVQPSHAEKNRTASANVTLQKVNAGPMRLYVGSLHYNITESMLRGIFEPFGKIDNIQLMMDTDTNRSKGYGFITFHDSEDAKRALEQLNGFELAGRPMKVNHVTERGGEGGQQAPSFLDSEELDKRGITLNTTGRLQLMAKLAEGTGFQIPAAAAEALHPLSQVPGMGLPGIQMNPQQQPVAPPPPTMNLQESLQAAQLQAQQSAQALAAASAVTAQQVNAALGIPGLPGLAPGVPAMVAGVPGMPGLTEPVVQAPPQNSMAPAPPVQASAPTGAGTTPCFLLSNMFDPNSETNLGWETEIRDDVIEECNKHGGVLHIHVDKASPQGNVYVKCPNPQIALAAVSNLHGRWFAGKMINAAYMPVANYHAIFPAAASSSMLLQPSTPRRV